MRMKKFFLPLLAALLFAGCSAAPEAQTPTVKFDAEVDYLIIGGGAAGIASAVEAADQGVENIMIVEKPECWAARPFTPAESSAAWKRKSPKRWICT